MKSSCSVLPLMGLCSLLGCAHAGQTALPAHVEDVSMMTANTTIDVIHTLDEYPELTPEGMGRRFLEYLDNLTSKEQLTPEFLARQMGVELTPEPNGAYFTMQLPDSGRQYAVGYQIDGATPPNESIKLWFSTGLVHDELDMAPVCGMDFDAYRAALERIGYKDGGVEIYHHGARSPVFYHSRGRVFVTLIVAGKSHNNPEHLCVTEINVTAGS